MPIVTHVRGPVIPGSVQRIFIAAPTTDGLHAPFVAALFDSVGALHAAGIQADLCLEVGNPHVDDARNSLVRQFLMTDCTDLVFIDSDVGWRAEDLVRLCQFDRDVVGGVYPKKTDEEEFPIALEPGVPLQAEADGCVVKGVVGLPTGFLRCRRRVMEMLTETFKARSFAGQDHKPGSPLYTIIFEREISGGKRFSGDYAFCRRWLALGGELAVDPSMVFAHEGAKQWVGQLASYWRRAHGVTQMAFDAAVKRLRGGDTGDDVIAALCEGWENGAWQGSPFMLGAALRMAKRAAGPILECGSGLSTLVLALARPDLVIHTLEHDPIWAMKTRDALTRAGVENVRLHYAPLREYAGGRWFDDEAVRGIDFALVINDGPPRTLANRALLYERLASEIAGAALLADDTHDAAQRAAVTAWAKRVGRTVLSEEDEGKGISVVHPPQSTPAAAA